MNLRQLERADIPACLELWRQTVPAKYHIELSTLFAKTVDHPNFLEQLSFAGWSNDELLGFIVSKADPIGTLYLQPSLNRIHINSISFKSLSVAHILLDQLESGSNNQIVFGQDNGHFFPGVPEEWTELHDVFVARGYSAGVDWANDLESDLREFDPPAHSLDALNSPGIELRRCSLSDVSALQEFFAREFPGRWQYDTVEHKIQVQNEPRDVVALCVNGIIEGFAYTQTWQTTKLPIAGCVWTCDLGPHWGGLGPIGVSMRVRGQKLGGAVLAGALQLLKESGVHRCIIDWTSLVEFYEKFGFSVTRRYKSYSLNSNS